MHYNGDEFKALVFEFMANGSLEKWWHPYIDNENQSRNLNLIQRLNIVITLLLHYIIFMNTVKDQSFIVI